MCIAYYDRRRWALEKEYVEVEETMCESMVLINKRIRKVGVYNYFLEFDLTQETMSASGST